MSAAASELVSQRLPERRGTAEARVERGNSVRGEVTRRYGGEEGRHFDTDTRQACDL